MNKINKFEMRLSALSENENFARSCAAAFCLPLNPTLDEINDVKTAVSEAVTNCIVHAYNGAADKYIDMSVTAEEGGKLTVTITDSGCGIEDVEKALQPFYTTKSDEERSGMGFTIMSTFMDELLVTSEKGRGTQVPEMLTHEQTLQLIDRAKSGDEEAKSTLITENMPLIKSIVKRYGNVHVEYEDLMQLGAMGLVKAVNNFDAAYNVKFSTYAVPMIAGEIKRFIRDDGAVKVSRALKTLSMKLHAYIDDYVQANGENPSLDKLAQIFGTDKQEIVFALDSNKYPLSIYEKFDEESSGSIIDRLPAKGNGDELIDNILLKELLDELPEREKTIIKLRYYKDMTQSEIAKIMGVSQVQISRIESKVISKMRKQLA